jgi:hypothetical protein
MGPTQRTWLRLRPSHTWPRPPPTNIWLRPSPKTNGCGHPQNKWLRSSQTHGCGHPSQTYGCGHHKHMTVATYRDHPHKHAAAAIPQTSRTNIYHTKTHKRLTTQQLNIESAVAKDKALVSIDIQSIDKETHPGIDLADAITKMTSEDHMDPTEAVKTHYVPVTTTTKTVYYRFMKQDAVHFPGSRQQNATAMGTIRKYCGPSAAALISDCVSAYEAIVMLEKQTNAANGEHTMETHMKYMSIHWKNTDTAATYIDRFIKLQADAKAAGSGDQQYTQQLTEKFAFNVFLNGLGQKFRDFRALQSEKFEPGTYELVHLYGELRKYTKDDNKKDDEDAPQVAGTATTALQPIFSPAQLAFLAQSLPLAQFGTVTQPPSNNTHVHPVGRSYQPAPQYSTHNYRPRPGPATPNPNYHGRFLTDGSANPHYTGPINNATRTPPGGWIGTGARPRGTYHPYARPNPRPTPHNNTTGPPITHGYQTRPSNNRSCYTCGQNDHISPQCPHRTANLALGPYPTDQPTTAAQHNAYEATNSANWQDYATKPGDQHFY